MGCPAGGSAPSVCVVNLGCRVNRVESDWLEAAFSDAGCPLVEEELADVVAVNTCAVTGEAESKARKAVRRAASLPRRPLVAVTGCVASLFPDEMRSLGGNVEVFQAKSTLARDVLAAWGAARGPAAPPEGAARPGGGRARRGVKVQDGCDNRCTFCIVWKARGLPRSAPLPEVERQVARVLEEGALEVDLTGINLGRYSSPDGRGGTAGLPEVVERVAAMARAAGALVRASSIEPPEVDERLVEAFARNADVVAPHLHLPLQSGSTSVLRRMGRRYTARGFLEKVALVRRGLPGAAVSTDVIAGFPGETREEFSETLALCREAAFSKMHVFRFSARPGTPAAGMGGQVDPREARERSEELRALAASLRAADAAARVGAREAVLVERAGEDGSAFGTTASHHEAVLPPGAHACGAPALVLADIVRAPADGPLEAREALPFPSGIRRGGASGA